MGRAAAVVALTCDNPSQEVMDIGKRLAMHVVAAKPRFLDESSIPQSVIEHERSVLEAQVSGSNKPANIIEKMIQGRLKKFIGEISLLGQSHMIVEGNPQIAQFLKEQSIQLGTQVRVEHFIRMQIGEEDQ
jgi:elongation factor Ts